MAPIDWKTRLGFVVGVLLAGSAAWAAAINHNGVFWCKLEASTKRTYLEGFADGTAISSQKLEELASAAEIFHWQSGERVIRQLQHDLAMPAGSFADTLAKLDRLYSDPRYAELDIGAALQLLDSRTSRASLHAGARASSDPSASAQTTETR